MADQECPIQVVLAGDFIDCTFAGGHDGPHSWQIPGAPETRPEPWTLCGECDRGIRWIPSPMCTCATGPNGEHNPYCGAEPCPNGCFGKLRPGIPVTVPDESQMAHCRDCAHRLGSGCGCECCPWAGDAVAEAAQAIGAYRDWAGTAGATDEALAREAVQAALPVVQAAAAAEERAKLQPAIDRVAAHLAEAAQAKAVEMAVAAERAEHLPCIPEPAGWVRHLQREHAEVAYPVPHCRKDRQNWPCDTIKALEMAAAAERERIADRVTEAAAAVTGGADAQVAVRSALMAVADLLRRGRG